MGKKKTTTTLALGEFLGDDKFGGGSWADEMDDLPTAPAPRDPNEPAGSALGGSHLSRFDNNRYGDRDQNRRGGDRDRDFDRPPRTELPVPDKPPYNAFVGNLSWEVSNADLEQFFGAAHLISIRMINDSATGKPKGYGYVEFDDRDALIAALDKSGRDVGGRTIRVSVAEAPRDRDDRTGGAWRREGPLPSFEDSGRDSGRSRSNGFERGSMDEDRGERMGFGSKFVPSTTGSGLGQRSQSGRGFSRGAGEGGEDYENVDRGARMGFGSKFVPSVDEPRRDREPPRRGAGFVPSRGTPAGSDDGHSASGGSGRRQAFGDRKPSESGLTPADSVSTWRSARSPNLSADRETPPSSSTLPPTRRKLELSARTASPSDGASTPPQSHSASASAKPSPFGSAKPVDSTEREKAIQEKLERDREELAGLVAKKAVGLSNKPSLETLSRPQNEETTPVGSAEATPSPSSAPKAPKPNPFGAAKPVDTLQKEMEIEEKHQKEKEQKEEKLRKDVEEAKLASSPKPDSPAPASELTKEAATTRPAPTSSSPVIPPSSKPSESSSWRSSGAEKAKLANGKASTPPAPATAPAPAAAAAPASDEPSPRSPHLSSFRKEGISFAALAKTASASSSPVQTPKPSSAGTDESRAKVSSQAPRTILKRNEGVSIQNQ